MTQDATSSVYIYLAIPTPNIDDAVLEFIQRLTSPIFKEKLENLLVDGLPSALEKLDILT